MAPAFAGARLISSPDPQLVERFATDLDTLVARGSKMGVAVSGGADSLALLLLAAAARPGLVEAATVDHALRPESRAEAETVAALCERIGVPHDILTVEWRQAPGRNLQARAREARYETLGDWAVRRGLLAVATAHHLDDQAETLLMRLARGAGVGGLGATRASRPLVKGVRLVRPLLGWRKAELAALVASAGVKPVDDPSNRDSRHDRVRMREWLKRADWANPERLAASAAWLNEADEALDWALAPLAEERVTREGADLVVDPSGIPRELQRRLLLAAFADGVLVGTVQVILSLPPNQPHRAEIAKLLVHRSA
ncbi:tRNA lysidine(34) synthetase TilS, partial [Sphingomonas sp.]|uniref:tRNA lysidine(34) synthetase TilS n=1 Tax=Sphingomonas sp. TaxID=28214 RepID=UPI00183D177A